MRGEEWPIFKPKQSLGFTLVEILIALFIFTIVTSILSAALYSVIKAQSGTEKSAAYFREIDFAWLMMSRDIEQAVNRPVMDMSGKEEGAFIGTHNTVTFTHAGWSNPGGGVLRSSLQRTRYRKQGKMLVRETWPVLDQAPDTHPHARTLLAVSSVQFQYVDEKRKFHTLWPVSQQQGVSPLPLAVQVILVLPGGRELRQLYVIPH